MPVSASERFRHLVSAHREDPATHEKLTKTELYDVLAELQPEDLPEAREIALDAMMQVELTDGALETLQGLLGIEPGVPSPEPMEVSSGTSTFALRIHKAQSDGSVGGTKVWQWEVEQALKTLRNNPSRDEVEAAVRKMLATSELTPDAVAATREFLSTGRLASVEFLSWPENGAPADFEDLTSVMGETIEAGFDLTRRDPNVDLTWNGPSTPDFAGVTSPSFQERLTVESLLQSEQMYGRDPLDVIMGVGIQLGMEQGRRAVMSSPGLQQANQQLDALENAFASQDSDQALQALNGFISSVRNPMMGGAVGSLMQPNGQMDWPADDLPVSMEELATPLRSLLEQAYNMEPIHSGFDIPWYGPVMPMEMLMVPMGMGMLMMPFDERLTASNLRAEEQNQGHDTLDVMVDMTLQMGMEQGRRMTVYQDFSAALQIAELAQSALMSGDTQAAEFLLPMLRQMWEL